MKKLLSTLVAVLFSFNANAFVSGIYKADGIDIDEDDKQVEITSEHKYLWNWEKQKWEK